MGRRAHLQPENGHETGYNIEDMVQKRVDGVWKAYIKALEPCLEQNNA